MPFVLQRAWNLVAINADQGVSAGGIGVGSSSSEGFSVSGDLRLLLAPVQTNAMNRGSKHN